MKCRNWLWSTESFHCTYSIATFHSYFSVFINFNKIRHLLYFKKFQLNFLILKTVFLNKKEAFFQPSSENLQKKIDFCRNNFEVYRKKSIVMHLIDPDNWTIRIIGVRIIGPLLYLIEFASQLALKFRQGGYSYRKVCVSVSRKERWERGDDIIYLYQTHTVWLNIFVFFPKLM